MKVLIAPTEDFIKRERTQLTAAAAAGSFVILYVGNSSGYAVNNYAVVGIEGSETVELAQVTGVTPTSITVAALTLNHLADEPIVKYRYNKRKFYGSLTATGTFTELTVNGSPKAIEPSDPQGTYFEYTTAEGYIYFKATYYNSQSTDESDINDANAVLADESVRYCSIYAIKVQAGLTSNPYITDGVVETYRKRAENEVNSYLFQRYQLPLVTDAGNAEIPFIVENCTTLLAAGYMDYKEFGKDGEGVKWLGEARAVLKAMQNGTQRLIGSDYNEFKQKGLTQGIQSYPDQVDNENGPTQAFTMNQVF